METFIDALIKMLDGTFSKELILLIISMIPILELRGGLLAASELLLNIPLKYAMPISIIGNLIPIPFILILIGKIFAYLKKTKTFKKLVTKLEDKAMSKKDSIEKCEFWGLVIFVGIPLPGTGAWTGALIASMLGINKKKAFYAISLGVIIAAIIMSIVSYGILNRVI